MKNSKILEEKYDSIHRIEVLKLAYSIFKDKIISTDDFTAECIHDLTHFSEFLSDWTDGSIYAGNPEVVSRTYNKQCRLECLRAAYKTVRDNVLNFDNDKDEIVDIYNMLDIAEYYEAWSTGEIFEEETKTENN